MHKAVKLILASFLLTAILCCSSGEEKKYSINLLEEFDYAMEEETQIVDFKKGGNSDKLVLRGWGMPEENYRWGIERNSKLHFYSYNTKNNIALLITCRAIPSPEGLEQATEVLVNGQRVGRIIPSAKTDGNYRVTIPNHVLMSGENILEFKYSYSIQPSNTCESKDNRELAIAFQKIEFLRNRNIERSGNLSFSQPQNSAISVIEDLPRKIHIVAEYENQRGSLPYILIQNEEGTQINLDFPRNKKRGTKEIILPEAGIYKITAGNKGAPSGYMKWTDLSINFDIDRPENSEVRQGFTLNRRPNIIFYVVDTLRADHMSCYGYHRNTTPNFDSFAEESSLFVNAYAPTSWTKPSAASILTGLMPKNHRTRTIEDSLPQSVVSLPEVLKEDGYYTAAFVTNGNVSKHYGFDQGFDQSVHLPENEPVTIHVRSDKLNDRVFEFLDDFMPKKEKQPLFLFIWSTDPHHPYTPPKLVKNAFDIERYDSVDTYSGRIIDGIRLNEITLSDSQKNFLITRYDQEILFNDISFGRLVDKLKELHIYDESIILFTADHGEEFFDHGGVGHGYTLYNEQLKIPFALKASHLGKGIYDFPIQLIDIFPTLMDILGMQNPYELDGISLLRPNTLRKELFFELKREGNEIYSILDKEKKLIFNKSFYRPVYRPSPAIYELFDINDFFELQNLSFKGLEDEYRKQKMIFFFKKEHELPAKQEKANPSNEILEKLRGLGYVK